MSNPKVSQVFNARDQLLKQSARLRLLQSVFGGDVVEQLAIAAVFHDEIKPFLCLDNIV